jgi:hypothetical protein
VQRRLAGKVFDNDRRSAAALNTDERAELLRLLKKLNTRRGAATARPVPEEALLDG